MAGMPYPQTVAITLDGKRLAGCGGDPMDLLAIGEWTVASVAGEPTGERPPTLQFLAEGRAAGFAGCNRWMGGASLSGEGLAFSQVATTMMACADAAMSAERGFLDALARITRHDFGADGSLQLLAGDTVLIVALPPAGG
jgi:heat shock protein HslJ